MTCRSSRCSSRSERQEKTTQSPVHHQDADAFASAWVAGALFHTLAGLSPTDGRKLGIEMAKGVHIHTRFGSMTDIMVAISEVSELRLRARAADRGR